LAKRKRATRTTAAARSRGGQQQCCDQVIRGYFGLKDHESVVHITCDSDFRVFTWARNVETFADGVQVTTPPSQFRTSGSTGPQDGLVMDVPAQTGIDLGCIGAKAGETIDLSSGNARITIFVTVVTCQGARIGITTEPAPSQTWEP
jgi:hypothetical protein